jgi:thiol-disulfide isomerase/thioredoxin
MTSIKKYIPVLATLSLGLVVLISQVFLKSKEINASPGKVQNKLNLHYQNNLKDVSIVKNGKKSSLDKIDSKIIIVNFWASWCVPCLEEFPSLVSLKSKYQDKDLEIVGINTDDKDSIKDAKKIMTKYKINFPIVFDNDGALVSKFKVSAIPITIIFNKGKVIEVSNGAKDFVSGEFLETVKSLIK